MSPNGNTMSSIGVADATQGLVNAAKRLVAIFRREKGLPEIISAEEMCGDNLEHYMNTICIWATTRKIPRFFNENLQPTNQSNNRCLTTSTLVGYIGQHLLEIRRQHPNHPDFLNIRPNEYPAWYTELRASFVKAHNRFKMSLGDDVRFGSDSVFPLYHVNDPTKPPVDDSGNLQDYISSTDLRFVLTKLLKGANGNGLANGPFEKRAQLNMNASGIGRAGEVKYQDYTMWSFDAYLKVFDASWMEMKTLMTYAMPLVPDDRWLFDPYHSFGAYWMMENGLYRNSQQIAQGKRNAVFPSLHSIRSDGVGKRMTKIIRENLPEGTPPEISKRFTAKSTRIGAITSLCNHKDMNVLRVCARSGHSTGTNVDSYRDLSDVAAGLPAAKALHGYTDVHAEVVLFSFDAIGSEIDISDFIDKLFVCSNDLFKDGGALRAILVTAAASLVTFHNEVTNDLGYANPLSTRLRDIARKVNLRDPRNPDAIPEAVLSDWSKKMLADFRNKSAASPSTQPELGAIAESLDSLLLKLNKMSAQVATLVEHQNDLVSDNAQKEAALATLHEQNARLEASKSASEKKHRRDKQKLIAMLDASPKTTPYSYSSRKRQRSSYNSVDNDGDADVLESVLESVSKTLFHDTTDTTSVMEINNAPSREKTRLPEGQSPTIATDEGQSAISYTCLVLSTVPHDHDMKFTTSHQVTQHLATRFPLCYFVFLLILKYHKASTSSRINYFLL